MRSVSEALTGVKDAKLNEFHNLPHYARAFSDFAPKSQRVLGGGSDTVSLLLDNGTVLKVGTRELPASAGQRAFDAPILESGVKMVNGYPVRYYVQPYAEPATDEQLSGFLRSLRGTAYYMSEPFVDQLGVINGQVKLLDPWAVENR